ncbi:MAG: hypothetical protein H5U02_00140 [Clostridia bacterium]|nr:hypothetical protein [Clostridia bacterium]
MVCPFKLVQNPCGNADYSYVKCEPECALYISGDTGESPRCALATIALALGQLVSEVNYLADDMLTIRGRLKGR